MFQKIFTALSLCLLLTITVVFSQTEKKPADKAGQAFRRQAMSLREYIDTKNRLPKLRKQNPGAPIKVFIDIDKEDADQDNDKPASTLTGYIKYYVGNDTTMAYEMTYDKVAQKITSVKQEADTPQATDQDDEDNPKQKHKKMKDGDNDDDEKPAHKKANKKQDDDDE